MFVYIRVGVWAFLVPAMYAWFWCAVILLLRGLENPRQKYLMVQQRNLERKTDPEQINNTVGTQTSNTTGLAPLVLDESPDDSEDFV